MFSEHSQIKKYQRYEIDTSASTPIRYSVVLHTGSDAEPLYDMHYPLEMGLVLRGSMAAFLYRSHRRVWERRYMVLRHLGATWVSDIRQVRSTCAHYLATAALNDIIS